MVSNPFNNRRADALILYGRRVVHARNATEAQLFGEPTGRTVSGYEVLDPGVVLVVFGSGLSDSTTGVPANLRTDNAKTRLVRLFPSSKMWSLTMCSAT